MDLIDTLTVAGVVATLLATAIGISLAVGGIQKRSMMEVIGAQMEIMDAQMKIVDAQMKVLIDKTDDISKEIESLRQEYRADMKDVMSKLKVERN